MAVTATQRALFDADALIVDLQMLVTFVDSVGRHTTQDIRRHVRCSLHPERVRSGLWNLDEQETE